MVLWVFTRFSGALGIHQYFSHPEACSWQVIEDSFTVFFVIAGSNEHGRLLQAGKCGRVN